MSVPKMVKNGQNSAFTTENRTALTKKTRKLNSKPFSKLKKEQKSFLANFGTRQRATNTWGNLLDDRRRHGHSGYSDYYSAKAPPELHGPRKGLRSLGIFDSV